MGPKPVAPSDGHSVVVVCPPEKHIDAALHEILEVLRGRMKTSERSRFAEVTKLVEGISQFEFLDIRRRIKRNFRLFSAAALGHELVQRKGRGLPNIQDIQERERRFLEDFFQLMFKARYAVLTQKEWLQSQEEDFELNMPVTVNWKLMDDKMLKRFWLGKNDDDTYYEHAAAAMVCHRGVGLAIKKDLFIGQKIDLLVEYTIVRWWRAARAMFAKKASTPQQAAAAAALHKQEAAGVVTMNGATTAATTTVKKRVVAAEAVTTAAGTAAAAVAADVEEEVLTHRNQKQVERRTLRHALPTLSDVIVNLHKKLEIKEPTFKSLILMYRKVITPPTHNEVMADPSVYDKYKLAKHNIFIKSFDELPMADLEMIMPDKTVELKPLSLVILLVTVAIAVVGFVVALFTIKGLTWQMLSTLLSPVLLRCWQSYLTMQREIAVMQQKMAAKVYDISLDSQEGVVFQVIDEMEDQYVKEVMLAYTLLLLNKDPMTPAALDAACEDFLTDVFAMPIDFAIDDSLPRLQHYGLVRTTPNGMIEAASLDEAYNRLAKLWSEAFDYSEEEPMMAATATAAKGTMRSVGRLLSMKGRRDRAEGPVRSAVPTVREGAADGAVQAMAPPAQRSASLSQRHMVVADESNGTAELYSQRSVPSTPLVSPNEHRPEFKKKKKFWKKLF